MNSFTKDLGNYGYIQPAACLESEITPFFAKNFEININISRPFPILPLFLHLT